MLYLLLVSLFFLLLFLVFFITYEFYTKILQPGAIYYPTTDEAVEQMLKLAKVSSKDTLIDIGSGDGRILMAAAGIGAKAIGYEINPFLVWKSRQFIHEAKLDKLATVYWKSFWKADFNEATVMTVYLFPNLMNRLQLLIEKKINHPILVVTNNYTFSKKKTVKKKGKINLYNFGNYQK